LVSRTALYALITETIGLQRSPRLIISSSVLSLVSFFYIYTIGSYFKVSVYILQNRVTYNTFFGEHIISRDIDYTIIISGTILWLLLSLEGRTRYVVTAAYGILTVAALVLFAKTGFARDIPALISIPMIAFFLIYCVLTPKNKIVDTSIQLSVNYLGLTAIFIAILSIIISTVPLLFSTTLPMRNYSNDILILLSSTFVPALLICLILCVPTKLLYRELRQNLLKSSGRKLNDTLTSTTSTIQQSTNTINRRSKVAFITFFVLLSVVLALIPHQQTINKYNLQISSDTDYYIEWINPLLESSNIQEFVTRAFVLVNYGDRPLTLIFLFTLHKLIPIDLFYMLDYMPVILGPLLVLAIYFLTRELTSNDTISLLASFLTPISFHSLIGIYAGFYANWIALIIGYMSFVFLIRFLKIQTRLNFVIYSVLLVILLFIHEYTWTILSLAMGVFLIVMLKTSYYNRRSIVLLLLVILSLVFIDTIRMEITGSSSGIEKDIENINLGRVSVDQFALRWSNLIYTTQVYLGGQFSNFIIYILGLYWLFIFRFSEQSSIFIIIFLSIGIIPLFFGDSLIQARTFYNIPFQIPAAIALNHMKQKANNKNIILFIAACTWLVASSIVAVSNFPPALHR
jgi:hypothetical protein